MNETTAIRWQMVEVILREIRNTLGNLKMGLFTLVMSDREMIPLICLSSTKFHIIYIDKTEENTR